MAVVKLSNQLLGDIHKNLDTPFIEKYIAATKVSEEDSIALYRKYLVSEEQESHIDAIKSEWHKFNRRSDPVYLRHVSDSGKVEHWLELQIKSFKPLGIWEWQSSPYSNSTPQTVENPNSSWPKFDLMSDPIAQKYIKALAAITEERDTYIASIKQILKSCTTLNQAQKIWPGITKYVGSEYIERLEQKVERKTAASVGLSQDDINKLSVQHIKLQMVK